MRKVVLGRTGVEVTELCFGTLPMGPLQKNMPVEEGSDIIAHALRSGVNFVDTAQLYKTYPHVRRAIEKSGITPVISTKSTAVTYNDMKAAVEQALDEMSLEHIDIFFLHAARATTAVFDERAEALRCLVEYRKKGIIKAAGISLHSVEVGKLAAVHPDIDIVFPLINVSGKGILEGSREDMEAVINLCHENGKGIMLMKILAGGNLINDYKQALDYAVDISAGRFCHSLGIVNQREADMNIKYFNCEDISGELANTKMEDKNFFVFKVVCVSCGICLDACHSDAISLGETIAEIDESKCIKCSYCVDACPKLAIRMH